jgi:Carboxypeptidase regulatory-like domain/S-layer homology domain
MCRSVPVVICLLLLLCVGLALPASADTTTRSAMMYLIAHSVGGFESFPPPATPSYTDVPLYYPTYAEIEYCMSLGICSGDPDGSFRPQTDISRGEGSTFVAREKAGGEANIPDPPPGTQTFLDVPPEHAAWKYIEYDAANGIYGDISNGWFYPDEPLALCDAQWWCVRATGVDVDKCAIPLPTGSVAGVVLDSALLLPIAGADVVVCGPSGILHTTSGDDGAFSFADVEIGSYTACARLPGYAGIQSSVEVYEYAVTQVPIYMELLPTGSLAGVVRDRDRLFPIAGADVMVCGPSGIVHTATGDDGTYSFPELAIGWYTACARAEGYYDAQDIAWINENLVTSLTLYMQSQTWIEDDNFWRISYSGSWFRQKAAKASAGHLTYSGQPGAYLQFSWDGTGLKCHFAAGPMMGKARVRIDGNYLGVFDLYSATKKLAQIGKTGLTPGNHEITIEVTGFKSRQATDVLVNIDAIEVVP